MSNENVVVVCPNEDAELVDTFAIAIGVVTVIGSVIAYFLQQERERKDAIEAQIKEDQLLDRAQALERVRRQLSVLIGPMHRSFKILIATVAQYTIDSGHGFGHIPEILKQKGEAYWSKQFRDDFLEPFIDDPYSFEAVMYRNFVTRRYKPMYTRVRELVLCHMGDLADMPEQEKWLERWDEADVMSPYNGSINVNVIFDTFVVYTYEYDDIIESWAEEDFRRMQPSTRFTIAICNDLIDYLYDQAKDKEAKYNKHVTVHKNKVQLDTIETFVNASGAKRVISKSIDALKNATESAKLRLENVQSKTETTGNKSNPGDAKDSDDNDSVGNDSVEIDADVETEASNIYASRRVRRGPTTVLATGETM